MDSSIEGLMLRETAIAESDTGGMDASCASVKSTFVSKRFGL